MDIQNSYRKIIEIMKNILEEIAARTRERIAKEKTCISVSELENRIQEVNKNAGQKITFLQALQKDGMSYICEVKKASPSKGLIAPDFPYLAIAKEYEPLLLNRQVQVQSPVSQNLFISREQTSI